MKLTETEKILMKVNDRLERTEQKQWAIINELKQENMILQDENMHLKDYLAEMNEHNKRMMARLYPVPCLTNRPRKAVNNGS